MAILGCAWPGRRKRKVHRTLRMTPVAFLYCTTHYMVAHTLRSLVDRLQKCGAVGIKVLGMPRVLEENTHPVFPSSPIMSRVDQVGRWEPCRQGPLFLPGVDTDQHPNHQGLSPEGLLKLPVKCIVVEGHRAVGIDNHQVIILGIGYQCGGRQQGLGESHTGFYGVQMSGGEVGHTVAVVRHQVPGQQHAATHELIDRQSIAPVTGVHATALQ